MAEGKATETFIPSLKYMLSLALLSSSLVEVSNGQCEDAYGCSFDEVCCRGICISGSSCKGQFCEFYEDCSSDKLICCNSVCVKRSNCLGEHCLDNSDCSVGEKCCKKKCVAGDHCTKKGSKCNYICVILLSSLLPSSFILILIFCCPCRKNQTSAVHSGDSGRQQESSPCDSCCPVLNIWHLVVQVENPDTKEGSAPPPPDHAESQGESGGVYTPQASYGAT